MLPPPTRHLQIHIQQVADTSEPRTGICKFNTSKLWMLPTPTRHLQIQFQQIADTSTSGIHPYMYLQVQYQQIADASNPDQASANSIPTSCRCFRTRLGICSSNTSKLQMLPTLTRHLQIHIQQVADTSDPDQASANPNPANCRYFQPRPGICCSPKQQIKDAHR